MQIHIHTLKKILSPYSFVYKGQDSLLNFSTIIIVDSADKTCTESALTQKKHPLFDAFLPICIIESARGFDSIPDASAWIIICNETSEVIPEFHTPVFIIHAPVSSQQIYQELLSNLFTHHITDSLYNDILDAMEKNSDMNSVLKICSQYLNAPFTIMSPSKRILASSFPKNNQRQTPHPITDNMKKTLELGYLVDASVDIIKETAHLDILRDPKANKVIKITAFENLDILVADLYSRNHFLGSLTMYGFYRNLTEYDIAIMHRLQKLIVMLIHSNPNIYQKYSTVETYFIFDLITQNLNKEQTLKLMQERGITTSGWLKAFRIIKKTRSDGKKIPLLMFLSNLEDILGNRFSIIVDDEIFIISELGDSPILTKEKQEHLLDYLNHNDLLCIISSPFTDISETKQIWEQTKFLLSECNSYNYSKSILYFQDYLNDWILKEFKKFSSAPIYHSGIIQLKQYDAENDTEYLKTLKTYIDCNCNLMKCAEVLNIHYNTAKYRMNMIKAIGHIEVSLPKLAANIYTYLKLYE